MHGVESLPKNPSNGKGGEEINPAVSGMNEDIGELIERLRRNLPAKIKGLQRFLLWRYELRYNKKEGKFKPTKVPYSIKGSKAKTNTPSTWSSFEDVISVLESQPEVYDGIGLVLGEGFMGVDFDNIIDWDTDPPSIDDYFWAIIGKLESYTELSPSRDGLHIIFKGTLPPGCQKKIGEHIEWYDETSARYFTLTGDTPWEDRSTINENDLSEVIAEVYEQVSRDFPEQVKNSSGARKAAASTSKKPATCNSSTLDDDELLDKAREAKNGEKFSTLYDLGDYIALKYPSASEGTAALLGMLAFWTGKDQEQMDRLFRGSEMYKIEGEKWDRPQNGSTWGAIEIANACELCTETFGGNRNKFPHTSKGGVPKGTIENLEVLLSLDGIDVSYDEIRKKRNFAFGGVNGESLYSSDNRDNAIKARILSSASKVGMPTPHIEQFLYEIADKNRCNPAKEWILSAEWDGTDRLPSLFDTITVQPHYPEEFKKTLMLKWLVSAVAAACHDPAKRSFSARGILTLQGKQSIGKTKWFMSLMPDDLVKDGVCLDPRNKDSVMGAIRHWVVELGEVESTLAKDVGRFKGFITIEQDEIRLPYAQALSCFPRRTIFSASVNRTEFLVDESNSRFWVLPVQKIDYQHGIDMQQVFRQVYEEYWLTGASWWLSPEEEAQLAELNRRFKERDEVYDLLIQSYNWPQEPIDPTTAMSEGYRKMTPTQVLEAMGIEKPSKSQVNRCARHLRELTGYEPTGNGREGRGYLIPPAKAEQAMLERMRNAGKQSNL